MYLEFDSEEEQKRLTRKGQCPKLRLLSGVMEIDVIVMEGLLEMERTRCQGQTPYTTSHCDKWEDCERHSNIMTLRVKIREKENPHKVKPPHGKKPQIVH